MPSIPRVLHVTNMFPSQESPAYGTFVQTQVRSLERLGVFQEVYVIPEGNYARGALRIRKRVREGRFDLVHAHYGLSGWAASWQSLPLVVTFAGSDLNGVSRGRVQERWRGRAEILASHWAALRARRVIVMTRRMLDLLRVDSFRAKACVLPYGIDTKRFRPGSLEVARQCFGLDPDAFVILWPHNDSPTKRRDLAEAATERLRRTLNRPVVLWKPHQVPHADMPRCYHAADCLLMVSDTEGSPTVVKEALSAAVPVVGVDVGDVWSWIERVDWCRRAQRDPTDIAQRLAEIGRAPRPMEPPSFIWEFDWDRVASELIGIYEDVLRKRHAS